MEHYEVIPNITEHLMTGEMLQDIKWKVSEQYDRISPYLYRKNKIFLYIDKIGERWEDSEVLTYVLHIWVLI